MKLTTTKKELAAAIAIVSKALPKRPTHPVLGYILIESLGRATATNLQVFMQVNFYSLEKEDQGSALLEAKTLTKLLKAIPHGEIILESRDGAIFLISRDNSYKINNELDTADYPLMPDCDQGFESKGTIPAKEFLDGIASTAYAASTDETKEVLMGVRLFMDKTVEFQATDGHRLSVATFPNNYPTGNIPVTIPAKPLVEVAKIISSLKQQTIEIALKERYYQITCNNSSFKAVILTMEGQYPDVERLIPKKFERTVTFNRSELLATLNRLVVFAVNPKEKSSQQNIIKMPISKSTVAISMQSDEENWIKEDLECSLDGSEMLIAFNIFYLIDALTHLSPKHVTLCINGDTMPVIITSDTSKHKALIMPIEAVKLKKNEAKKALAAKQENVAA